jgi:hypothetical protein
MITRCSHIATAEKYLVVPPRSHFRRLSDIAISLTAAAAASQRSWFLPAFAISSLMRQLRRQTPP